MTLAAYVETLRLERTAHNWRVGASEGRSAASDERNASDPRSEEVAPGRLSVTGPPALAGDFPFAELQRALNRQRDARQATTLSDDCGSYVCNALYYHSLAAVRERRHRGEFADALFVHVPKIEPTAARELGYRLADTLIEQLERMEP